MKNHIRLTVALLLMLPLAVFGQSRLRRLSFYSHSVHDTMHVVVLLPTHYDPAHAYPVLFLLHGYGGDQNDWTTKTFLADYTSHIRLIVVMPEAKNSWYVNSQMDPREKYEDYIIRELPKFINEHFPIDTTREAIAGLSMGGYGALMLGLRYPRKFQFIGDLSGAITIPQIIDSVNDVPGFNVGSQRPIMPSIIKAFGKNDKRFRDAHNVFDLLERDPSTTIPYIFMAAGTQDGYIEFRPADHAFIDSLHAHGDTRYEYHELPGQHDWKFWNEEVRPMLRRMESVMELRNQ
ncbi:MAG: esterase family protein [Bacteroidetes bacterium]|nr:esterase family protein [Bacteroidota bacterium]